MGLFRRNKVNGLSDVELVAHYKQTNDTQCVGVLFERYSHLVLGVCLKYLKNKDESKDMVMYIFERLVNDLKTHEVKNFKGWIHTVTRNHCLMFLRKNNRLVKQEADFETVKPKINGVPSVEEAQLQEVKLTKLEEAIDQLNDEQQQCIRLFYLESKCYADVSEITGYDLKHVKSHIQNGKRNLKNLLMKSNEFTE